MFKPTWDVITNAPGARDQVRRGGEYIFSNPTDSAVTVLESAVAPFTDVYNGIVNRDANQVGRGLSGFAFMLAGARAARNPAIGLRNPLGGRVTAGGQSLADCFATASSIATRRNLPAAARGALGRFLGRRGVFDPMLERFGVNAPRHAAVQNVNGTITDPTIFDNIQGYGPIPKELARYQRYDTFTPSVYSKLLDAFYNAWKNNPVSKGFREARPDEIINWE